MAITTSCFEGRFGSPRGSGSGSLSIADHSCSISAARSPTLRLLSTPGSAFHNARSRLPLSGAASSSSFDETTISPSLFHQQIAQVLVEHFPETVQTQPELLAHHYTEAGLLGRAVMYWQKAGQHASQ